MIDRSLFLSPDGVTFDGERSVPSEEVTKLMLELADLKPGEKVLEIGTGSGYQTCAIAGLVNRSWQEDESSNVYSVDIELSPEQMDRARRCGANIFLADGKEGWPLHPRYPRPIFDAIIVSCGMTSIPPAYEEQLREGGRLVIPLGKPDGQELLRLEKRNGKLVMGRCAGYVRFQMCS